MDLSLYNVLKQQEEKVQLILEEYKKKEVSDQEIKNLVEERDSIEKERELYKISPYMQKEIDEKIKKLQEEINKKNTENKKIQEKIDGWVGIPKSKNGIHGNPEGALKQEIQKKIENRQSELDARLEKCEQEKEFEKDPERIEKLEILIKGLREQTKINCKSWKVIEPVDDMKTILDQYIKESQRQKQKSEARSKAESIVTENGGNSAEIAKHRTIAITKEDRENKEKYR